MPRVKPNTRLLEALRDCDAHCGLRERGVHGFEPPQTTACPRWLGPVLACACLLLSVAVWVPLPLRVAVALAVSLTVEGARHPH